MKKSSWLMPIYAAIPCLRVGSLTNFRDVINEPVRLFKIAFQSPKYR